MIVVNIAQSYAELLRKDRLIPFYELRQATVGFWPVMSDATMEGYADYLVGVYNDMIVTAYEILKVDRVEHAGKDKLKFIVDDLNNPDRLPGSFGVHKEADSAAWLIGGPVPGGPWKKGEARGTRRYALEAYLEDHPEMRGRKDDDFPTAMSENLFAYFRGDTRMPTGDFPALERPSSLLPSQPTGGVTVSRQPNGTVVIVIPTGTRAQLTIDPSKTQVDG